MNTLVGQIDKMFFLWKPKPPKPPIRRPQADPSSAFGRRHEPQNREKKPLAQSALIYRARLTLTLSLIKPAVARLLSQFKSNYQGRNDALQPKESNYL